MILLGGGLVVIINPDVFDSLNEDQQAALRTAATATVPTLIQASRDEDREALDALCSTDLRFVTATDDQLVEIRTALEPVYADLASDPQTADYLEEIAALKQELGAPPDSPACEQSPTVATDTAASIINGTETSEPDPAQQSVGRIVFSRFGGEFVNTEPMFIANADGSDEQLVTDAEGICCPWVAKDGSRLAIQRPGPDGRATVEIINLDGSGSTVLVPPGETLNMFPGPFSPDGSQMAFNAFDPTDPSRNGIYIGSSDDPSDAVQVASAEPELGLLAVDYSPDGTQLVLYDQAPGDDTNVHGSLAIVNADGTDLRPLTPADVDVPCCVRWSPDGSKILFADLDGRMLTSTPTVRNSPKCSCRRAAGCDSRTGRQTGHRSSSR